MKYLFIVFSVLSLYGCTSHQEGVLTVDRSSYVTYQSPPVVITTINNKATKVNHLDLTRANVTFLTKVVTESTSNAVIADIQRFNDKNNNPIYLILDTPGGNVMDGARVITAIQTSKNPVITVDIGMCASMGFMILEHGFKRYAVPRAILMAHPASIGTSFQGELDKAVSRLSFLKRFVDKMDYFIAERAGIPYEAFKLRSNSEMWIDSNDALSQNFLDGIVSVKLPVETMFTFGSNKLKEEIRME